MSSHVQALGSSISSTKLKHSYVNNEVIYDAVVIGSGAIAASIFFNLSSMTKNVCLIALDTPTPEISSCSDGLVRGFDIDKELMQKAMFSCKYYKNFEKHTGIGCSLLPTGFLYFPKPRDINQAKQTVANHTDTDMPIHWMDVEALQKKFGSILNSNLYGAVYEPMSGFMDPIEVTKAWIYAGCKKGGKVKVQSHLHQLIYKNKKVVGIETNTGQILAENIIIASDTNNHNILDGLSIPHQIIMRPVQIERRLPLAPVKNQPAYIDACNELSGRPDVSNNSIYVEYPLTNPLPANDSVINHELCAQNMGMKRWRWVKSSRLLTCNHAAQSSMQHAHEYVNNIYSDNLYMAMGFNDVSFKIAPWIGVKAASILEKN